MSTVLSTVTAVQSAVKEIPVAFKHPLDPLTPDEVVLLDVDIGDDLYNCRTDNRSFPCYTAIYCKEDRH